MKDVNGTPIESKDKIRLMYPPFKGRLAEVVDLLPMANEVVAIINGYDLRTWSSPLTVKVVSKHKG